VSGRGTSRDTGPVRTGRGVGTGDTAAGRRAPGPERRGLKDALDEGRRRLRVGEPGPPLALFGLIVIWIVFQSLNENFLSPRNLSNLSVDVVGTGLIAVGIVFVLLIGELDLSVGSVGGLAGAVFAVQNVSHGMPEWLAAIVAVLCGTAIGAVHGFFFARIGVPAFVVTLAGLLAWNGLMRYILGDSGTISLHSDGLVAALTSHYFTSPVAAYGLAALGTAVFLLTACRDRSRRGAAGMPYQPLKGVWVRTGVLAVTVFAAAYVLNQFHGLPLALLIFLLVVVGLDYVLRRTTCGRRVFALGGGVEAARRAGINVAMVRISVFMISGTMAAVGGLFLASRISSASQAAGSSMLLVNAIAAAVIGGTSLFGGCGRTWSALLGMLVIQSIASGMALLGVQTAVQFMITGGVLLAAVTVDSLARRSQGAHGKV
jgi:D-xylose transport system permease protein